MWPFTPKPKPKPLIRSAINGVTVKALLDSALRDRKRHDYRHFAQKEIMSVITRADVDRASRLAWQPWREGKWECEDQARALIHEAQKLASSEGRSWAIGELRARPPRGANLHVYTWAIVQGEGRSGGCEVYFYNPTEQTWVQAAELNEVDYSRT